MLEEFPQYFQRNDRRNLQRNVAKEFHEGISEESTKIIPGISEDIFEGNQEVSNKKFPNELWKQSLEESSKESTK